MKGDWLYPGGVPYSVKYPEIPVYAFLENSARKFPNRDALIFYGTRLSYNRLWDQALRLSSALRGLGVQKGDRVGFLLPNTPHFPIAYYGTLAMGGVVVAINPLNPDNEVERELEETGAETLIVLDRFLQKIPEEKPQNIIVARAEAFLPQPLKLMSRLQNKGNKHTRGGIRFEKLLEGPLMQATEEIDSRGDLAVIQYTGGTTGPPKGVMLNHFNLVANTLQTYFWLRGWGHSGKPQPAGWPVVLCAVPFFHIYGMTVALNEGVSFGSTLVLVPDPKPEAIMKNIQRYAATHFPAIPKMIRDVVEHPQVDRYDLTSLTSCVSGGTYMDPALVERFIELSGARFYLGYGLTEAGPVTHCTPIDKEPRYPSVGIPLPDTEAKIVDLQMGEVELGPEEAGELLVRGPQIMAGYWRDPEQTDRILIDGWLHTGDVARLDGDGYTYIVDRKEEQVISSGHTVWPTRIEEVLMSHPAVESVAVLGVPDPLRCATEIMAVITLKSDWDKEKIDLKLKAFCKERLKPYETPSKIGVAKSLPRTPLGKVDLFALRKEFETL